MIRCSGWIIFSVTRLIRVKRLDVDFLKNRLESVSMTVHRSVLS